MTISSTSLCNNDTCVNNWCSFRATESRVFYYNAKGIHVYQSDWNKNNICGGYVSKEDGDNLDD